MLSDDSTSNQRKRTLFIVFTLLLAINAGVVHFIVRQVFGRAYAQTQVKDDQLAVEGASTISDTNTPAIPFEKEEDIDEKTPITVYTVKDGDTLSSIATKFDISVNTIRWANDLTTKTSTIHIGDQLTILPVSGIEYTVKKGDTLSAIVLKFDANEADILAYNDIEASAIAVGTKLIIPNAEPVAVKAPTKVAPKVSPKPTTKVLTLLNNAKSKSKTTTNEDTEPKKEKTNGDRFSNPIPSGILTQRIHDGNAVDFGAPVGTTVHATKAGTVLIAKGSGYNGGYGNMIVINHTDGSQTLYAHLSKVNVSVGDTVEQNETIGLSGNSGYSTGPHLHYKESNTGTRNTFASLKLH